MDHFFVRFNDYKRVPADQENPARIIAARGGAIGFKLCFNACVKDEDDWTVLPVGESIIVHEPVWVQAIETIGAVVYVEHPKPTELFAQLGPTGEAPAAAPLTVWEGTSPKEKQLADPPQTPPTTWDGSEWGHGQWEPYDAKEQARKRREREDREDRERTAA